MSASAIMALSDGGSNPRGWSCLLLLITILDHGIDPLLWCLGPASLQYCSIPKAQVYTSSGPKLTNKHPTFHPLGNLTEHCSCIGTSAYPLSPPSEGFVAKPTGPPMPPYSESRTSSCYDLPRQYLLRDPFQQAAAAAFVWPSYIPQGTAPATLQPPPNFIFPSMSPHSTLQAAAADNPMQRHCSCWALII
ncbi:hypothetical protein EVAR_69634_1 [Eumeta japonica]|uniref:Uncharacterized protein n=1 Tax=Eumeta variegata TaxID=151549 RepID=A0A4C2AJ47_EUMVA|nr:hypothetical protein EVAR_69634_1 [Eumeta japonica]